MIQRRIIQQRAARLVLLCLLVAACGTSSRTKALRVNLVAVNVARDTMLTVSKEREAQIVEKATSKEEGRAQIDAWRAKVDVVAKVIDDAYRAIHDAALLNNIKSEGEALAAVAKALALIKELKQ